MVAAMGVQKAPKTEGSKTGGEIRLCVAGGRFLGPGFGSCGCGAQFRGWMGSCACLALEVQCDDLLNG